MRQKMHRMLRATLMRARALYNTHLFRPHEGGISSDRLVILLLADVRQVSSHLILLLHQPCQNARCVQATAVSQNYVPLPSHDIMSRSRRHKLSIKLMKRQEAKPFGACTRTFQERERAIFSKTSILLESFYLAAVGDVKFSPASVMADGETHHHKKIIFPHQIPKKCEFYRSHQSLWKIICYEIKVTTVGYQLRSQPLSLLLFVKKILSVSAGA